MPDKSPSTNELRRLTRRIAITIALVLAIAVPLQYAATSYYHKVSLVEQVGTNASNAILRTIYLFPGVWMYQDHRLYEHLDSAILDHLNMAVELLGTTGEQLAMVGKTSSIGSIERYYEVRDGGDIVARLRVAYSATPLLLETLIVAVLGLIPAILFYLGLKVLPFRLLETAWSRLRTYQNQLKDEMQEKEGALRRLRDAQERMEFLAMHDSLTGLANRNLLKHQAELSLAKGRRESTRIVLLLIDLENFGEINESYGHEVGDRVLRVVGHRLRRMVRDADVVARLGADEFAVILANADEALAVRLAERLRQLIKRPIASESAAFNIESTIGLAWFPDHATEYAGLLRAADLALRQAKRERRGHLVWNAAVANAGGDLTHLAPALIRAVTERRIQVHYQPVAELSEQRLMAVEAVPHWHDERYGGVSATDFLPIAERHGQIEALTDNVLEIALEQLARWLFLYPDLRLLVKYSGYLLRDEDACQRLLPMLDRFAIKRENLCLEVTEDSIMTDPVATRHNLAALRRAGIGIALDNFGAGYSSIANLATLELSLIKIDPGFVRNLTSQDWAVDVVRSTVGLARGLETKVLAEGVDSLPVWRRINELGCDFAQGNLLAPVLSAQDLTHLIGHERLSLRERSWLATDSPGTAG